MAYSGTYHAPPLQQAVDYVGDGSANRVVSFSFTPKWVVLIEKSENAENSGVVYYSPALDWELQLVGQAGATLPAEVPSTDKANFAGVVNGINVGHLFHFFGGAVANHLNTNYRVIAYGW